MKRIVLVLLVLGVLFVSGLGIHAGLVNVANGAGTMAERAQATCATCHGS